MQPEPLSLRHSFNYDQNLGTRGKSSGIKVSVLEGSGGPGDKSAVNGVEGRSERIAAEKMAALSMSKGSRISRRFKERAKELNAKEEREQLE